jgi:single-strand DNA-binding protein
MKKGRLVGIQGRIQTGKYEKNGQTIYTVDVLADRVEFLDRGDRSENGEGGFAPRAAQGGYGAQQDPGYGGSRGASGGEIPGGFTQLTDDDIPF